jgi:hypothetical protein
MSEATVRAKFVVTKIAKETYQGGFGSTQITLEARGDSSLPEDKKFHEATPNGRLEMTVTNQSAIDNFRLVKSFILILYQQMN